MSLCHSTCLNKNVCVQGEDDWDDYFGTEIDEFVPASHKKGRRTPRNSLVLRAESAKVVMRVFLLLPWCLFWWPFIQYCICALQNDQLGPEADLSAWDTLLEAAGCAESGCLNNKPATPQVKPDLRGTRRSSVSNRRNLRVSPLQKSRIVMKGVFGLWSCPRVKGPLI